MKKLLLFGFGAALWFAGVTHAQSAAPTFNGLPKVTVPELEAVAGNPEIWMLKPGSYNTRQLLEILAQKSGGKAIFDDEFGTSIFTFNSPIAGQIGDIIQKVTGSHIAAGKSGADWLFVRRRNSFPGTLAVIPGTPLKIQPFSAPFNWFQGAKPVDPKDVPPGATPFEFNGHRVYHVPLLPKK